MIITLLFVIQILVTLALIGVVLLQKSDGGALGSIGGGSGMSGFMTGRSTANLLTRTTAILAAVFFGLSILLVVLSNQAQHQAPRSFLDQGSPPASSAPAPAPAKPAAPAAPAAPLAK